MSAKDRQVNGDHYKNLGIQPMEYAMANNFNYYQSHALSYLTRYPYKGMPVDDLRKLKHLTEMEIERLTTEVVSDADYPSPVLNTAIHPDDGIMG